MKVSPVKSSASARLAGVRAVGYVSVPLLKVAVVAAALMKLMSDRSSALLPSVARPEIVPLNWAASSSRSVRSHRCRSRWSARRRFPPRRSVGTGDTFRARAGHVSRDIQAIAIGQIVRCWRHRGARDTQPARAGGLQHAGVGDGVGGGGDDQPVVAGCLDRGGGANRQGEVAIANNARALDRVVKIGERGICRGAA